MRLFGGLGNQLFQYALGRNLSLNHKVPLSFDLSGFEPRSGVTQRQFALAPFNLPATIATPKTIAALTAKGLPAWVRPFWRRVERRLPLRWRRTIMESRRTFQAEVLQAEANVYVSGYWQEERYFAAVAAQVREDIIRRRTFAGGLGELAQEIERTRAVSVHVRRGDYVNSAATAGTHGSCSSEYYAKAERWIEERLGGPRYFVFSDDIGWASKHLVLRHPAVFVSGRFKQPEHVDLWLMSLCRHHLIANSSFSWWGAWLGEQPGSVIVAPRQWFAPTAGRVDSPVPDRWVKV